MEKEPKLVENAEKQNEVYTKTTQICPVCKSERLIIVGRCSTCGECGWSACSM